MRKCFDAVNPQNIPDTAQMVAGYVDGLYAWKLADWARFPHAVKVQIAVFASTNAGHVLDCESGDATPAECPAWVAMRRKAGEDPSVYTSYGNLGQNWAIVINAFKNARVAEPHYWIAAYPGIGPVLYPGSHAHQYQGGMTAPVDISVVADYWPGVDPAPVPPIPPAPRKVTMILLKVGSAIYLSNGQTYRHLSPAEYQDWARVLGTAPQPVSQGTIDAMSVAP
jgi:hypothetical protein